MGAGAGYPATYRLPLVQFYSLNKKIMHRITGFFIVVLLGLLPSVHAAAGTGDPAAEDRDSCAWLTEDSFTQFYYKKMDFNALRSTFGFPASIHIVEEEEGRFYYRQVTFHTAWGRIRFFFEDNLVSDYKWISRERPVALRHQWQQ